MMKAKYKDFHPEKNTLKAFLTLCAEVFFL